MNVSNKMLKQPNTSDIFKWLSNRDRLRIAYTEWLKRENFEYFIVLKFYDGHSVNDASAVKSLEYFLRKLDRKLVGRFKNNRGVRLDRMVLVEHGETGENTHFNLYINKPDGVSDFDLRRYVLKFWKQTTGWDDANIQNSDNSDDVLFYSTKEIGRDCNKEVLIAEHCHLTKLHNTDIQQSIRQAMLKSVADKQKQAKSLERMERVKKRLRLSSKICVDEAMGTDEYISI